MSSLQPKTNLPKLITTQAKSYYKNLSWPHLFEFASIWHGFKMSKSAVYFIAILGSDFSAFCLGSDDKFKGYVNYLAF